jgi:hypothetical protein
MRHDQLRMISTDDRPASEQSIEKERTSQAGGLSPASHTRGGTCGPTQIYGRPSRRAGDRGAPDLSRVQFNMADVTTRDGRRLGKQLRAVYDVMRDEQWWTADDVYRSVMARRPLSKWKLTSIDRQIRYLRDVPGLAVDRRYVGNGLYQYRLSRPEPVPTQEGPATAQRSPSDGT